MDPISRTAPQIAILVKPETVGKTRLDFMKDTAVGKLPSIFQNIEDANVLDGISVKLNAALGNIEPLLVR
jgi:hypothetical protein